MTHKKICIDDKQAKVFARAIHANISDYIQNHQAEYQAFLQQLRSEGEVVFFYYGVLAFRKYLGYGKPHAETREEERPEEG